MAKPRRAIAREEEDSKVRSKRFEDVVARISNTMGTIDWLESILHALTERWGMEKPHEEERKLENSGPEQGEQSKDSSFKAEAKIAIQLCNKEITFEKLYQWIS